MGTASSMSDSDLVKAIVGMVSDLDMPQGAAQSGRADMVRYLVNESDERRQQWRSEVLGTTRQDFVDFADAIDSLNESGKARVVVVGGDGVKRATEGLEGWEVADVV